MTAGPVLGVACDYHDSAVALVGSDGDILFAAEEERFSRRKHDSRLPVRAARTAFEHTGVDPRDLAAVVYYEQPLAKLDRLHRHVGDDSAFGDIVRRWLATSRADIPGRLSRGLGIDRARVALLTHHLSHAASAFYCSPFEEAAVVVIDGVGEDETVSVWRGRGLDLEPVASCVFPHSLGLFYSAFTAFLGFEVNEGEYKVMGMAPFGRPRWAEELLSAFSFQPDGSFRLRQHWFDFRPGGRLPYTAGLAERFGPPRPPGTDFPQATGVPADWRRWFDLAASVQVCAEEVILRLVRDALQRTGLDAVCLAGGVALNSVANGRVNREVTSRLFVQPAAGDAGGALGAALWHVHGRNRRPRRQAMTSCALGRAVDFEEALAAARAGVFAWRVLPDEATLTSEVARRLAAGQVIGWVQGRSEWGPRALGQRSILASPLTVEARDMVNLKIKYREPFRPFAPSVTKEAAADWFELPDQDLPDGAAERFMLSVCPVRADRRDAIPAVTHVDGSARVHVVDRRASPLYHALIQAFGRCTGVPVLLNTSFNVRGEPLVDSAADAMLAFALTDLDALAIDRVLVTKETS